MHADGIAGKQTPSVQPSSITFPHDAKTFPTVFIVSLMDAFIYLPIYLFGKTEPLTFSTDLIFYPELKLEVNDPKPSRTAAEWTLLWGDAKVWRGACLHKASCPTAKLGKNSLSFFLSFLLDSSQVSVLSPARCTPVESCWLISSCVSSLPVGPPPNLNSSHSSDL